MEDMKAKAVAMTLARIKGDQRTNRQTKNHDEFNQKQTAVIENTSKSNDIKLSILKAEQDNNIN